jgi:predicted transcriptional regulator
MRWNQKKIMTALAAIPGAASVKATDQGSEYCTNDIIVSTKSGERLWMMGFNTRKEITTPEDTTVEMVELSDGTDSRGGLQSNNPEVIRLYGEVRIVLTGMGAQVVAQMKDYF